MELLRHLLSNDHGEWNVILAVTAVWVAFSAFVRGFIRDIDRRLDAEFPRRYRVVHQKVHGPFFNPSKVETIVYGPYRTFLWSALVAHAVCGPWDHVDVQVKREKDTP